MERADEYFCPNCKAILNDQDGFDPSEGAWACTNCGQQLMDNSVYDGEMFEGIAWYCDKCNSLLNLQEGFSDTCGEWKCTECNHRNLIDETQILDSDDEKSSNGCTGDGNEKPKTDIVKSIGTAVDQAKGAVFNAMDVNGDGQVDITDVIIAGLNIPGIRIIRDDFLKKELKKLYPEEIVELAVSESPMKAKIPLTEIDKIANKVIEFERTCVSGISAALGTPGGWAMVATIPADIAQYYGYLLRAAQKLLYLYGFPQIETGKKELQIDDATMNTLIICFGIMYGTAGAHNALKTVAKMLGTGVEKQLMKKALTKGLLYPVVKSIAKWFGVKMTKKLFTSFFSKAIPLLGGLLAGGLTYLSFKPCCEKLKSTLRDTILSNPNYKPTLEDDFTDFAGEIIEET